MDVGSLCKRNVVSIPHTTSLQEAARQMRQHHVGALVVTSAPDAGAKVMGLITDRDLVIEAMAQGLDASATPVSELASEQPIAVPDTTGLSEAIDAMRRAGVRRLLVTTPDRRLAGIVSLDDLLGACAVDLRALSETVLHGFEREAERRRPLRQAAGLPLELSIGQPSLHWQQAL